MKLRNALLLAGLAVLMAGCVVNPRPAQPRYHDYGDDYYDYRNTPSYEGYYYARIIFIRDVPYYVDDNRYIRPIPPRLHDHFRRYRYDTLRRPPVFSRDSEVRDGYPMSRIIYLDGIPYHVGDNRIAQPLPERLQQRFRYTPAYQGNSPANGNRPYGQRDNGRNDDAPAYGRDRDRFRDQDRDERGPNGRGRDRIGQPPFDRDQRDDRDQDRAREQGRDERGPNGRDRDRIGQPPFDRDERGQNSRERDRDRSGQPPFARGQREGEGNAPAGADGRPSPFFEQRQPPLRQDQPDVVAPRADTPRGNQRHRNDNRPEAGDDRGSKETDEQDNRRKARRGNDDDQQGNGNRRD